MTAGQIQPQQVTANVTAAGGKRRGGGQQDACPGWSKKSASELPHRKPVSEPHVFSISHSLLHISP